MRRIVLRAAPIFSGRPIPFLHYFQTEVPLVAPDHLMGKLLPASLTNTGNLTLVGQLTEADTAYAVITQISVGSAADLAAVVAAGGELRSSLLLQNHRLSSHFTFLLN